MLGEQSGGSGGGHQAQSRYRPPLPPPVEDEYASENVKRFTVDSLLQIRPEVTADKLHVPYDGEKRRFFFLFLLNF